MSDTKICPICKKRYFGHPAISRKDNKTEICPNCGINEAMEAYENHMKQKEEERRKTE